jgi:hypothetical protein
MVSIATGPVTPSASVTRKAANEEGVMENAEDWKEQCTQRWVCAFLATCAVIRDDIFSMRMASMAPKMGA